jgi:hypothetical protein
VRPAASPALRVCQLAATLTGTADLLSLLTASTTLKDLRQALMRTPDPQIVEAVVPHTLHLRHHAGTSAVDSLLINSVLPMLFVHARQNGEDISNFILHMFSSMPAENNNVIRFWQKMGIHPESACQSQALLHMRTAWCARQQCLTCIIGRQVLLKESA